MAGYPRGEADFAADRFRREARPASLAPKDYSVPLHVDCSIEYELPDCAKPPQGVKIEPLLMIHPSHFRRLESLRRVPFVNNLPRAAAAVATAATARRCCRAGAGAGAGGGATAPPAPVTVTAAAAPAQPAPPAHYRLLLDELAAEPALAALAAYPADTAAATATATAAGARRHHRARPHPHHPYAPDCDDARARARARAHAHQHPALPRRALALQQLPIYM